MNNRREKFPTQQPRKKAAKAILAAILHMKSMITRNGAVNKTTILHFSFIDNKIKKITYPKNSKANQIEYSDVVRVGLKLKLVEDFAGSVIHKEAENR